jgi:Tfp pilus assembly protein PilO
MRATRNILAEFEKKKYLENLKILSTFRQEKVREYAPLVFTIFALSFFGLFAINPTVATIVELRRKLADYTVVDQDLTTKITNLSLLRQKYDQMQEDLPIIYAAVPEEAEAPDLLSKIQSLAKDNSVTITALEVQSIPLGSKVPKGKEESFNFSFTASGSYDNLIKFADSLSQFDRIITTTTISINRPDSGEATREMLFEGKAYYIL